MRRREMVATLRSKLVPLPQPEVIERWIERFSKGSWLVSTWARMRLPSSSTRRSLSWAGSVSRASDLQKPTARYSGCLAVQSRVTTSRPLSRMVRGTSRMASICCRVIPSGPNASIS